IFLCHRDKGAAGKARHRGEVERGDHAIGVHVVDAQLRIIGAGTELFEGAWFHAIFAARAADDGVQTDGREALAIPRPDILAIILYNARSAVLLAFGIVADESL